MQTRKAAGDVLVLRQGRACIRVVCKVRPARTSSLGEEERYAGDSNNQLLGAGLKQLHFQASRCRLLKALGFLVAECAPLLKQELGVP